MELKDYVNKHYRIQITENEFYCLPFPKEVYDDINNTDVIPKNSIVKILDFSIIGESTLFHVQYCDKKYMVSEDQVKKYFIQIFVREKPTKY
jgi:hypothetical protein